MRKTHAETGCVNVPLLTLFCRSWFQTRNHDLEETPVQDEQFYRSYFIWGRQNGRGEKHWTCCPFRIVKLSVELEAFVTSPPFHLLLVLLVPPDALLVFYEQRQQVVDDYNDIVSVVVNGNNKATWKSYATDMFSSISRECIARDIFYKVSWNLGRTVTVTTILHLFASFGSFLEKNFSIQFVHLTINGGIWCLKYNFITFNTVKMIQVRFWLYV